MTRRLATALVLLAALAVGCAPSGEVVDAGAAPTLQPSGATPAPSATASVGPSGRPSQRSDADDRSDGTGEGDEQDRGDDAAGDGEPGADQTTTVSVYFTRGEGVAPVRRVVPKVARIGSAALDQLLAGPTATEAESGYATQIPEGTRLRDLAITDRIAIVDLSGEFESGGGTLGLSLRLAQVACTLDAFPTVDGVRFAVDGQVVDVFSGDGLITDEPVTCADYTRTAPAGTPPPEPEPS